MVGWMRRICAWGSTKITPTDPSSQQRTTGLLVEVVSSSSKGKPSLANLCLLSMKNLSAEGEQLNCVHWWDFVVVIIIVIHILEAGGS